MELINEIKKLLNQKFVDYGYQKVGSWLRKEGYIINDKKVYRLMKEHKLLNQRIRRDTKDKRIANNLLPKPKEAFEAMQTDIKYIHIHGKRRNALLITVLDVYSRAAIGYMLKWSITKREVINVIKYVSDNYIFPKQVSLRTDNGSQFEASLFREYLSEISVTHEFTHVASPQENCYIESYHSIIESAVCQKYQFESLDEAQRELNEFLNFYNQERIHGGLNYQSPAQWLQNQENPVTLKELRMA
jgi:putative transposase